jgi:hypothetical protein
MNNIKSEASIQKTCLWNAKIFLTYYVNSSLHQNLDGSILTSSLSNQEGAGTITSTSIISAVRNALNGQFSLSFHREKKTDDIIPSSRLQRLDYYWYYSSYQLVRGMSYACVPRTVSGHMIIPTPKQPYLIRGNIQKPNCSSLFVNTFEPQFFLENQWGTSSLRTVL